jgi:hypothetical protein
LTSAGVAVDYIRSRCGLLQEQLWTTAGVAVDYSRSSCGLQQELPGDRTWLGWYRQVDRAQLHFRGLGALFRVLEFFVPTVGCIRMSATQNC